MKNVTRLLALAALLLVNSGTAPRLLSAQTAPAPKAPSQKGAAQESAEEIGSLRNAKVAIPMTRGKTELTYFAGSLTDAQRAELAKLAPNVKIVNGLTPAAALARAGEAQGIDSRFATADFIKGAPKLAWIQAMMAGVDRLVAIEPLAKNDAIVLTNFRGVHGPAIADHAMAMLLSLTRDLRFYAGHQTQKKWAKSESATRRPVALDGLTMLVVGLGGIGSEVAQRANGFGMRVIGTRRSNTPSPAYIQKVGLSNDLMSMLPEADVVAICVPLTPETQGMINQAAFATMKKGAYLINVARGPIVDSAALVEALKSGHLAGACLDVTDPEPLPASSPLWEMPNVVITPHVAPNAEVTEQRSWTLLRENIRRFGAGEPLLNVVDKVAGY
ncbi:MAG: hypothetical protein RIQ93_1102 [Verrucomicrobiota bacterium]|jgi:phosphoglycerate dehydrogenase-like enzyme